MKRREFLGAPAALLVLPFAGALSGTAAAANTLQFTLLRLAGSGGDGEVTGGWQSAWPQAVASLTRARIVFRGVVQAAPSTLGPVDIESAFFSDKGGGVNLAHVYSARTGGVVSGSKAISFGAEAASFGGLVVTPVTGQRSVRTSTSVTLGDSRTGRLTEGRYALLHGSKVNAADYVWSGYDDRPLSRRDRRAVTADYLVFDVEPA